MRLSRPMARLDAMATIMLTRGAAGGNVAGKTLDSDKSGDRCGQVDGRKPRASAGSVKGGLEDGRRPVRMAGGAL
jgi:hypothetical protein